MEGIFGTRADLLVDLFLLALLIDLPLMGVAILLARRGRLRLHKVLMATCYGLFLAGLLAFEMSVRMLHPVEHLPLRPLLIHLCFSGPCAVLWTIQVVRGRRAPTEPARHGRRGRLVFALLVPTVVTGVWLYLATYG